MGWDEVQAFMLKDATPEDIQIIKNGRITVVHVFTDPQDANSLVYRYQAEILRFRYVKDVPWSMIPGLTWDDVEYQHQETQRRERIARCN